MNPCIRCLKHPPLRNKQICRVCQIDLEMMHKKKEQFIKEQNQQKELT